MLSIIRKGISVINLLLAIGLFYIAGSMLIGLFLSRPQGVGGTGLGMYCFLATCSALLGYGFWRSAVYTYRQKQEAIVFCLATAIVCALLVIPILIIDILVAHPSSFKLTVEWGLCIYFISVVLFFNVGMVRECFDK